MTQRTEARQPTTPQLPNSPESYPRPARAQATCCHPVRRYVVPLAHDSWVCWVTAVTPLAASRFKAHDLGACGLEEDRDKILVFWALRLF